MADNDQLLKQIGNLIATKLEPINKKLDEQSKDIKTLKADVSIVKDFTAHIDTGLKTLDNKIDATKEEVDEIKRRQRPQHAD